MGIKEGWEALSTRKLADHVEYSTTIIYTHFKNKEAILLALRERGFEVYLEIIEKETAIHSDDPIKAIKQISLEVFHMSRQAPEIHKTNLA